MTRAMIVLIAAFAPMLIEASRSRRNERFLRRAGAVEPPGDVYALMQFVYPSSFIAMIVEGFVRGGRLNGTFIVGAAVFVAGKALKYWAISSLGERWTFRVLVLPEAALVASGPYRYLRHPNYVGVAGELVGAAFMAYAPVTGVLAVFGFGALMLARIRVEERALDVCAR